MMEEEIGFAACDAITEWSPSTPVSFGNSVALLLGGVQPESQSFQNMNCVIARTAQPGPRRSNPNRCNAASYAVLRSE